jgi:uncharacterized membrane protein
MEFLLDKDNQAAVQVGAHSMLQRTWRVAQGGQVCCVFWSILLSLICLVLTYNGMKSAGLNTNITLIFVLLTVVCLSTAVNEKVDVVGRFSVW